MKSKDLKKRLHSIETDAISEIEKNANGSIRGLSTRLFGNENTLGSILARVRKDSPYKAAKVVKVLEEMENKGI